MLAPPILVASPPSVAETRVIAVSVGLVTVGKPLLTVLDSIVTAPFSARARPYWIVTPVFRVMLAKARMFPANAVLVPKVAELPTCQYTSPSSALFVKTTAELLAVVSVLPIWKTKTALGLPPSLSVRVPVS